MGITILILVPLVFNPSLSCIQKSIHVNSILTVLNHDHVFSFVARYIRGVYFLFVELSFATVTIIVIAVQRKGGEGPVRLNWNPK